MKLFYDRKSKDPVYYAQLGIRNGKKTTTRNVARIGKHSELLKLTDDPLAYAKEQIKKMNEEYEEKKKAGLELRIDFTKRISASENPVSEKTTKNIGYFYLNKLYTDMKIEDFWKEATKDSKITFDADLVNRFLTYARILEPDSKLGTQEHLSNFYRQPEIAYQHILRFMDVLYEHYEDYISYLYQASAKVVKRDTSVCYYDCTNYYCEAETDDEDYVDEVTGETIPGIRKHGIAKDHKPNPLVEMGLFMDTNGIPISMCIAPGNTNEQKTVIPLEKQMIRMFGEDRKRFIYCADAGLSSYHIRNFNAMGGRAFVVTQSVKKLSDDLKKLVFEDSGYRMIADNKPMTIAQMKAFDRFDSKNLSLYNGKIYKEIEVDTPYDIGLYETKVLSDGTKRKVKSPAVLKQRIIITFSRKSMEYQQAIRNRQIERAKALLKAMNPDEYKKGPNDVTRFIKKKEEEGKSEQYELDKERIAEEEKYDGFYAIATNLEDSVETVLSINEQRYQIEDCFRILKTNFASRPYYHRNRERIIAHFVICYTALLLFRILENRIKKYEEGITVFNIIETLQNMEVSNIEDMCYLANYTNSKTLRALERVYNLDLTRRYYLPKDLNRKV